MQLELKPLADEKRQRIVEFIEWAIAEGVRRDQNVWISFPNNAPEPGKSLFGAMATFGDEVVPGATRYETKGASPEIRALAEGMKR